MCIYIYIYIYTYISRCCKGVHTEVCVAFATVFENQNYQPTPTAESPV